jgi:hypothetical protein
MEEGCQVFIKEEADEHEDAKEGNPASSSGSADTDKQVNRDFIFYFIIYFYKIDVHSSQFFQASRESCQVFIKEQNIEETKDSASCINSIDCGDPLAR